ARRPGAPSRRVRRSPRLPRRFGRDESRARWFVVMGSTEPVTPRSAAGRDELIVRRLAGSVVRAGDGAFAGRLVAEAAAHAKVDVSGAGRTATRRRRRRRRRRAPLLRGARATAVVARVGHALAEIL